MSFDKYGAVLRVTGKTGDRRIRLVASTLTLQAWINEHPMKNDPESYLWCKIPTRYNPKFKNDYLSYGFICRLLRTSAENNHEHSNASAPTLMKFKNLWTHLLAYYLKPIFQFNIPCIKEVYTEQKYR